MPIHRKRLRRYEVAQQPRFLTFSCYHQLPLLGTPTLRDAFVERLIETRARQGFSVHAWVVMPEHVHLFILPNVHAAPVRAILWDLKLGFARQVLAKWKELDASILTRLRDASGRLPFWQAGGGYDRNYFGLRDPNEVIGYIHHNPVERGLVRRAVDWEWSSAGWFAGERSGPIAIDPLPR